MKEREVKNMTYEQILEQKTLEARNNNLLQVRREYKKDWVQEKIHSYCKRWDGKFTIVEIEESILNNDIIASMFAKDPSKQNISEKLVGEILNITKLPAVGKNCIRFTAEGDIVSNSGVNVSKSADFKIGDTYYTQKYTKEEGGAQDNQYNDVVDFLTKGSIKHKVGAILNGAYWHQRINGLREHFRDNPNVHITNVDELRRDNE